MAFELPYKTLTPILGEQATYDPTAETTPDFMNGKFNELLKNDTEIAKQINDLKGETWEINFSSFLNGWGHGDYRTNRLRRIGNTVVGTMSVKAGSLNYGDTILVFPDSFKTQRGYDIFVKDAWFFIDSDGNLKVAGCGSFKIGDMITIPIVYTK